MHQQRSTKGASKARRDCINVEINQIKDVLPVSENVRRRLSQLQVMALCNSYIAKSNCFLNAHAINDTQGFDECSFFDFSEALPGFLLAITSDGKILYISENVTEYLGHSMVELMTQAETIYDVIDGGDQSVLRDFLVSAKIKHDTVMDSSRDELDFTCRVNLARLFRRNNVFDRQKMIKIHGRFIWPEGELHLAEPIFVARCSPVLSALSTEQPTIMDTTIFHTSHSLDMKYINVEDNGEFYLGYHKTELIGISWYQFIHPDDTQEACRKHTELIQGGIDAPRSLVVRIQNKYGSYLWLHIVMYLGNSVVGPLGMECSQQEIFCLNHVLDERDALETKRRENMDLLMPLNHFRPGMCEPAQTIRETQIPTVVVDERFIQPSATQVHTKAATPNRQELMEKIKFIAMENKNKKPRLEEVKSHIGYNTVAHAQHGMDGFMNADSNGSLGAEGYPGLLVENYSQHGPLTPPYSDDGRYDQINSPVSVYSPRSNNLAYTPPYSPPNLDDASLFDSTLQIKSVGKPVPTRSAMREDRGAINAFLPELDETDVEIFLEFECKKNRPSVQQVIQKQNLTNQFLLDNNYLAESFIEHVATQNSNLCDTMELMEELTNTGSVLQLMTESQQGPAPTAGYSYGNNMLAAAYGEGSFLDMIESPLSLKNIDSTTLQLLTQSNF